MPNTEGWSGNLVEVDVAETVVEITAPGNQGPRGYTRETAPFTYMGTLATYTGLGRWVFPDNCVIKNVAASVAMNPSGADVVVDVNLNGTTIFTDQNDRPRILDGTYSANVATDVAVTAGDYATVDIDQVGSTYAGDTLVVILRVTVL